MENGSRPTIRYFVNGEIEETDSEQLTVAEILEKAGFTPITDWKLESENPKKDYDSEYDAEVHIHEDQKFIALHKGPHPVSGTI